MWAYVRSAVMFLRSKGDPDVEIMITSQGGEVTAGLDIYDMLRMYPGSKKGVVIDQAASMGAVILQGCNDRHCAQHSGILIHHVSRSDITLDVMRSAKCLEETKEDMERRQRRLYKILSDRTGQTQKKIREVCAKDEFMTAEEALKFGLIDEIFYYISAFQRLR